MLRIEDLQWEEKVERGCGYRKRGALYLVSKEPMHGCGLLPREETVCPCCGGGVKQKIGWAWVEARLVLQAEDANGCGSGCDPLCGVRLLAEHLERKVGLIWIGAKYYPTPADFVREGIEIGLSRRIHAVPKGFELGKTWVLLAHPLAVDCRGCKGSGTVGTTDFEGDKNAITQSQCSDCNGKGRRPGVFGLFRPTRIELICTPKEAEQDGFLENCEKRGLTPVLVSDDDADHIPDW